MNEKPDNSHVIAYFQMDKNKKKILNSKESYEKCAKAAYDLGVDYYTIVSTMARINIMNAIESSVISIFALSCELFIKSILLKHQIRFNRTHELNVLFDMLPHEIKEIIKAEHPSTNIKKEHFELNLQEVKNAFPILRYGYEYSNMSCNVAFILELANTLKRYCDGIFKEP